MPADKSEKSTTLTSANPFAVGVEWVKPLADTPGKLYTELLNFAAKRLRTQADFLQGLADCKNPAELFQQQTKFFQTAVQEYSSEATKSWKAIQETSPLARPQT